MNYEQKYKEALDEAKAIHKAIRQDLKPVIEQIFPELKESEDERIRKVLIGWINLEPSISFNDTFDGFSKEQILAWLERQGEQKPVDKVEPKFKNGQWIVWKDKCYKVNYNGCGYELVDQNGLSTSLEYGTIDENAHLWTINDVKDGDVLVASDDSVFIFARVDGYACIHHIALANDGALKINPRLVGAWESVKGVKPATKEQRDLLFQKMKEASYELHT